MPGPQRGKGPNRTSDAARARAVELERQGVTHERIVAVLKAEGLGSVGRSTLTKILIAARAEPARAPAPRARATRAAPAPPMPMDGADGMSGSEIVRARLAEVRSFIAEAAQQVSAGAGKATVYKDLVKLETDLASRLVALDPGAPPDPELDPANADARQRVVDRIAMLLEASRQRRAAS